MLYICILYLSYGGPPAAPPCHGVSRPMCCTKDAMSRPVTFCHVSIFFDTPAKLHENRLIAVG